MAKLVQHPRCPYCHESVQPHERKAACDACMSWHHQECWDADGKCAACAAGDAVGGGEVSDGGGAAPAKQATRPKKALQPVVPLPKGIEMQEAGGALILRRRWFHWSALFLTFFCIFWDGFLCVWYGAAASAVGGGGAEGPVFIMFVFPLLHVAVGVGLTYFVLCSYLNTTEIKATSGELSVRHGPLPWPGNLTLDARQLDQLYCKEKVSRGKNGTTRTYELYALDRAQKQTKLLSGLQDADQVRYLEQELEQFLSIEDRAVDGELA